MALTQEQEAYLADFADKGLAEIADAEQRAKDIETEAAVREAEALKLQEVQAQAQALVDEKLPGFQAVITPTN